MTWKNVFLAAAMVRNRDGSRKSEPFFWRPEQANLKIPKGNGDHGRPVLSVEGDNPDDTFVLVVYEDRVEGKFQGQSKILARLE